VTSINRQPTGWLGFLGIKNFGRNPATAADVLAPTWDLADLYLSANRQFVSGAISLNAIGTFPAAGVPAGQVWYVHGFAAITNILAVGNTLQYQVMLYNVALGNAVPIAGTGPAAAVTAGSNAIAALQSPIILQPGEALGVYVTGFAGAAIGAVVNTAYTRLDA